MTDPTDPSHLTGLDLRTPVLVGAGQFAERPDDAGYRALSPVDVAAEATRAALADTGLAPDDVTGFVGEIDVVACTRQFETSTPFSHAAFGRSANFPRSVAGRVGADPRRAVLESGGGQSPQGLVTEFARAIAAGEADAVLVCGGEAMSTVRHLAGADDGERPDWTEDPGGQLEDRGYRLEGQATRRMARHGLVDAPSQYATIENARRAARGETRAQQRAAMGALFAPFSRVAATNPLAVAQEAFDADRLAAVDDRNRMIATPYPRLVVSRDLVNQGAAVVLTSVGTARRLGIAEDRWVFLTGHADLREQDHLVRPELGRAPAPAVAVRHALDIAGAGLDEVRWIDLYSCFPVAVSNVIDDLGLAADDPRGLTLTGGLPFFGGPGNGYSMHAIAEAVDRCRRAPGTRALVVANGGVLLKHSVGVYTTTPTPWREDDSPRLQADLDRRPTVPLDDAPDGRAVIESYTVRHDRDARRAVVIGRLVGGSGARFLGAGMPGDDDLLDLLDGVGDLDAVEPIGTEMWVRTTPDGVRVTLDPARLAADRPRRRPELGEAFEFVRVERDGPVLEVTTLRAAHRGTLPAAASAELAEVVDAYLADPELRVLVLAADGADFCAGRDLADLGNPPVAGFGGLTARPPLPKPVIAAVAGAAAGAGFELALACTLVVADVTARFALDQVRHGGIADAGGLARLPRFVPPRVATELALTGRPVPAAEALDLGLVNRVVPAGEALRGARELAALVAGSAPTSVRATLAALAETGAKPDLADAVLHPARAYDDVVFTADAFEGMAALAEGREPRWLGH